MSESNLTWAQVLAWRIKRQQLDHRAPREQLLTVVQRICGLQAQVASAATLALWARVEGIKPDDVTAALWQERTLVKRWAMRGTLHLLPAADIPLQVAAERATRRSWTRPSWRKYHGVSEAEMTTIIETARTALSAQPMTRAQFAEAVIAKSGSDSVGAALLSGWGAVLKPASYYGYLCFGPPQGQNVTFVNPRHWLGDWQDMDEQQAIAEVVRRYLHVYGPATTDDFARWWGVDAAVGKKMLRQISSETLEVEVEGWHGWLLKEDMSELAQATIPLTVRLLPNFDPYTVAANRGNTAIVADAYKSRVYRTAGWISPVLLNNGVVSGVWQYTQQHNKIIVTVEPFAPLTAAVEAQIAIEAQRLGQFLGSPAEISNLPRKPPAFRHGDISG